MSTKLHQVVREIMLVKQECLHQLVTVKVDAHQDEVTSYTNLSFHERLNVHCDAAAKQLIRQAIQNGRHIPFPFELQSPTVVHSSTNKVLSTIEEIKFMLYQQTV